MKTNDEFVNEESNASQCNMILKYMKEVGPITQMTALNEFGCFRLASRIHDLRKRGENIIVEKITTSNGRHIAQYRMAV